MSTALAYDKPRPAPLRQLPPGALPTVVGPMGEPRPPQPTIELERLYRKQRLAAAFRAHSGGPMPESLLTEIDSALAAAVDDPDMIAKQDALIGLVGIRRGLFPESSPYLSHPSIAGARVA